MVALLLFAADTFAEARLPSVSLEYAVKATYLYKFAPFVGWPQDAFESSDAPLEICLVGHDPFHGFLEKAVVGRKLGTHPFTVRRLAAGANDPGCRIVFIGETSAAKVRRTLRTFDGEPVLTVTDSTLRGAPDSIVRFVMDDGHVRFEVNNAAAARNHLTISSKLLSLALKVKEGG